MSAPSGVLHFDGLFVCLCKCLWNLGKLLLDSDAWIASLSLLWMYGGRLLCLLLTLTCILPFPEVHTFKLTHDVIARDTGSWQDCYYPTQRELNALQFIGGKQVIDRQPFRFMPIEEIESQYYKIILT